MEDKPVSTSSVPINLKVQVALQGDLVSRYEKLEKAADSITKSFATFVDELTKLKQASSLTDLKVPVNQIASEMNNNSIFLTKMLTEQLRSLHGIINPEGFIESSGESV